MATPSHSFTDPNTAPLPRGNLARYGWVPGLPEVEVLSARFRSHRFSPHTHATWAIGAVARGAQNNAARDGVDHIVKAGELTAIAPGEVHAGRSAADIGCEYAMVYVPDALVQQHAAETTGVPFGPARATALGDIRLAKRLVSFAALASRTDVSALTLQTEWCALMDGVVLGFSRDEPRERRAPVESVGMKRAVAFLHAHWSKPVSLETLASEASMSPSYFCRQFTRLYGLSPHRYQVVLRVARAKELLTRREAIADVAALTGFSDQSHLGRHLKSCLGITPGELRSRSRGTRTFYPPR